jgi:hypothetical protein
MCPKVMWGLYYEIGNTWMEDVEEDVGVYG